MSGFDPGQVFVQTLVSKSEPLVVDTEEMQKSGLQIAHVNRFSHHVVGKIVRFSMDDAASDAASRHPDAETTGVVISTVGLIRQLALAINSSAKLSSPDHQSIFEQTPVFQILAETSAGLIDVFALALGKT